MGLFLFQFDTNFCCATISVVVDYKEKGKSKLLYTLPCNKYSISQLAG